MKKILLIALLLTGCTKVVEHFPTEIRLSETESVIGEEYSFEIRTDGAWRIATNYPEWLSVEPTDGTGTRTIIVTAQPNEETIERQAKLTIGGGGEPVHILLRQLGAEIEPPEPPIVPDPSPNAPALIYPSNNVTGISLAPQFQWQHATNGVHYTAYIGTSEAEIDEPLTMSETTDNMATATALLKRDMKYYWRLRGNDGTYSAIGTFRTGDGRWSDGEWRPYMQNVQTNESGTVLKPVNVVITGDGFIESDYVDGGWFDQMADLASEYLMSTEPTISLRDYFRISKVCAVSRDRGVTNSGLKLDTAFGMEVQGGNTYVNNTLGDYTKLWSYAKQVTGIDDTELNNTIVICLINMDLFAGTCGMFTNGRVVSRLCIDQSTSVSFRRLVIHESIGHGLGKLGDEYVRSEDTLEGSDRTALLNNQERYGWYLNVSASESPTPWDMFIGLNGYSGYEAIGAYEGAYVYKYGCWKSEPTSLMATESTGVYFNAISRYLIYQRVLTIAGETPSFEKFLVFDEAGRNQEKPYDFPFPVPAFMPEKEWCAPEIINY